MSFQPQRLGPGAIYHRSLDSLFRSHADLIQVAEIEPQALWTKGTHRGSIPRGSPAELQQLSVLPQRRLLHGVGYPIGGTHCDQQQHIGEFSTWADTLESPWFSEHLSILAVSGATGTYPCGFLMPPLQTKSAVHLAAENIRNRRDVIGRPFAFETGVNYFAARNGEMPDGDFFAAVAEAANCGILLDLTNLWVNHKNGRANIHDVLSKLPLERVWEVHLAGIEYAHGYWLDAHSREIDPDLLVITADLIGSLPNLGTIIFEMAPDRLSAFGTSAFLREMERLQQLWERTQIASATQNTISPSFTPVSLTTSPQEWEEIIAQHLLPKNEQPTLREDATLAMRAEDERSFVLYGHLVASFREGTIAEMLENTLRLLLRAIGAEELRALMERYFASTIPLVYPTDEALAFCAFLVANPMPVDGLEAIIDFEAALVEAAANSSTVQIALPDNMGDMLAAIAEGNLPASPSTVSPVEIGVTPGPFIRLLETQPA